MVFSSLLKENDVVVMLSAPQRLPYVVQEGHECPVLAMSQTALKHHDTAGLHVSHLVLAVKDGHIGFLSAAAGWRFLQYRCKSKHELCFFSPVMGVWEQWLVQSCQHEEFSSNTAILSLSPKQDVAHRYLVELHKVGTLVASPANRLPTSQGQPVTDSQAFQEELLHLSWGLTCRFVSRVTKFWLLLTFRCWVCLTLRRRHMLDQLRNHRDRSWKKRNLDVWRALVARKRCTRQATNILAAAKRSRQLKRCLQEWALLVQHGMKWMPFAIIHADNLGRRQLRQVLSVWRQQAARCTRFFKSLRNVYRQQRMKLLVTAFAAWVVMHQAAAHSDDVLRTRPCSTYLRNRHSRQLARCLKAWRSLTANRRRAAQVVKAVEGATGRKRVLRCTLLHWHVVACVLPMECLNATFEHRIRGLLRAWRREAAQRREVKAWTLQHWQSYVAEAGNMVAAFDRRQLQQVFCTWKQYSKQHAQLMLQLFRAHRYIHNKRLLAVCFGSWLFVTSHTQKLSQIVQSHQAASKRRRLIACLLSWKATVIRLAKIAELVSSHSDQLQQRRRVQLLCAWKTAATNMSQLRKATACTAGQVVFVLGVCFTAWRTATVIAVSIRASTSTLKQEQMMRRLVQVVKAWRLHIVHRQQLLRSIQLVAVRVHGLWMQQLMCAWNVFAAQAAAKRSNQLAIARSSKMHSLLRAWSASAASSKHHASVQLQRVQQAMSCRILANCMSAWHRLVHHWKHARMGIIMHNSDARLPSLWCMHYKTFYAWLDIIMRRALAKNTLVLEPQIDGLSAQKIVLEVPSPAAGALQSSTLCAQGLQDTGISYKSQSAPAAGGAFGSASCTSPLTSISLPTFPEPTDQHHQPLCQPLSDSLSTPTAAPVTFFSPHGSPSSHAMASEANTDAVVVHTATMDSVDGIQPPPAAWTWPPYTSPNSQSAFPQLEFELTTICAEKYRLVQQPVTTNNTQATSTPRPGFVTASNPLFSPFTAFQQQPSRPYPVLTRRLPMDASHIVTECDQQGQPASSTASPTSDGTAAALTHRVGANLPGQLPPSASEPTTSIFMPLCNSQAMQHQSYPRKACCQHTQLQFAQLVLQTSPALPQASALPSPTPMQHSSIAPLIDAQSTIAPCSFLSPDSSEFPLYHSTTPSPHLLHTAPFTCPLLCPHSAPHLKITDSRQQQCSPHDTSFNSQQSDESLQESEQTPSSAGVTSPSSASQFPATTSHLNGLDAHQFGGSMAHAAAASNSHSTTSSAPSSHCLLSVPKSSTACLDATLQLSGASTGIILADDGVTALQPPTHSNDDMMPVVQPSAVDDVLFARIITALGSVPNN